MIFARMINCDLDVVFIYTPLHIIHWMCFVAFITASCNLYTCLSRTSSLHVISFLIETDVHTPKSHISLSGLMRKMLHVLNSNPITLGNNMKFHHFLCLPDQELCAVAQYFWKLCPIIMKQLRQEGFSLPKKVRQPYWILTTSEEVPVYDKDISKSCFASNQGKCCAGGLRWNQWMISKALHLITASCNIGWTWVFGKHSQSHVSIIGI